MSRIAIIGAGPRAAQALDRLATVSRESGRLLPWVDVIAPGEGIGGGEIYAPEQPDWLRLNVSSAAVDDEFDAWRERRSPGSTVDQFPPRSVAGEYLAEAGEQTRSAVPGSRITGRVHEVHPGAGRGWSVVLTDGGWLNGYSEVLLATGHASDWDGALIHQASDDDRIVPRVFPIARLQERAEQLSDGDVVVVRGAALTALDAALTLAQERELRIVLASRTGRLMVPKSNPEVVRAVTAHAELDAWVRPRVLSGESPESVLLDTANCLFAKVDPLATQDRMTETVTELFNGTSPADPRQWLDHQLDIAVGMEAHDVGWALGQAWRLLYPALVERQDQAPPGAHPLGWPDYGRWAREMERLAFGPPPVNAAALLELMDKGVVDVVASSNVFELAREREASLIVDAVLPPPGARGIRDHLITHSLDSALMEVSPHGRGVVVDRDATTIVGGRRVEGFSAVGRVTEDVVIGNDTLIRTLHPHVDRWARRILGVDEGKTDG